MGDCQGHGRRRWAGTTQVRTFGKVPRDRASMPFSFSPLAMGTSVYLYMSSLPVVNAARHSGNLGKMVLLPFVCMGLNCFLWASYGFAVSNVKVLAPALFGLVLSIYYLAVFYALTDDKDLFWHFIQIMMLFCAGESHGPLLCPPLCIEAQTGQMLHEL